MINTEFDKGQDQTAEEFEKNRTDIARDILKNAGIDEKTNLGKIAQRELIKALEDGIITPEEFARIFDPFKAEGEKAGKILSEANKNS